MSTAKPPTRGSRVAAAARTPATARNASSSSTTSVAAGGGGGPGAAATTGAATSAGGASNTATGSVSTSTTPTRRTAAYREILVARSDGVRYTAQQILEASGQAVGEALGDDVQRHDVLRAWCVRLGRAVQYNLGRETGAGAGAGSAANSHHYLVRLPRGYTMHTRSPPSTGSSASAARRVAVFGHPLGAGAAYVQPAELALHVLWLLSASTARADCSCRLCVRMVAEASAGAPAAAPAAAPQAVAPQHAPSRPPLPTTTTNTTTISAAAATGPPAPATNPPPLSTTTNAVAISAGARLPAGGSADLFRPWELVWYQHITTPSKDAWRLGIVLEAPFSSSASALRIAPLGIDGTHPLELAVAAADLRPFLSFSVPAMRARFQDALYDQLDWRALLDAAVRAQQPTTYDPPTIALEASKAAANQINACVSLLNRQPPPPQTENPTHLLYGGVFLGAELILVGDAVRVDPAASDATAATAAAANMPGGSAGGVDILQVAQIVVERASRLVWLVGDVYCLASWTPPAAAGGNAAPPPHALPQPAGAVFAEEVADRNAQWRAAAAQTAQQTGQAAAAAPPPQWYWHCKERRGNRAEAAVHGRFYASARLAVNLQKPMALEPLTSTPPAATTAVVGAPFVASALNRRQKVDGFVYRGWRAGRAATVGSAVSVRLAGLADAVEETALL